VGLIADWRLKPTSPSLSLREARAGREPERGDPYRLLSPALSSLGEEREKKVTWSQCRPNTWDAARRAAVLEMPAACVLKGRRDACPTLERD